MARLDEDVQVPVGFLCAGVAIYLGLGFYEDGFSGLISTTLGLLVGTTLEVVLGVGACMLTAYLLSTSFGYLTPAIIKLASIIVFSSAVATLLDFLGVAGLGWLASVILLYVMVSQFFELELFEVMVFAIILFLIRLTVMLWILKALYTIQQSSFTPDFLPVA